MKERKLYSLTGKLIVFLLLIVFAASTLFGGIQTLMLSSVGLTPNAAAKKYAFEETTACGTLVQRQLHNVMSYYNDMSKFGTNGRYLSLIHISEPTRPYRTSRMPSSA